MQLTLFLSCPGPAAAACDVVLVHTVGDGFVRRPKQQGRTLARRL